MIIEQDALELETIASIKSGQFRFVDENDVGYFIGEVMDKLEELGIAKNTLLVCMADNGPMVYAL